MPGLEFGVHHYSNQVSSQQFDRLVKLLLACNVKSSEEHHALSIIGKCVILRMRTLGGGRGVCPHPKRLVKATLHV